METIGIIRYILGYILGLYWGYIGIMEKKMETTLICFPGGFPRRAQQCRGLSIWGGDSTGLRV